MNTSTLPFWMLDRVYIVGAEEGEGDGGSDSGSGDGEGGSDDGSNDGDGDGSNDGGDGNDDGASSGKTPAQRGLERDLNATRRDLKAARKELTAFQQAKKEQEDKEKTEVDRLNDDLTATQGLVGKYSEAFLKLNLDREIERAAKDAGFHDVKDALLMVDRSEIEVDQDEDDPTQVTIKSSTVTKAVKAVATSKPHLIAKGTSDGGPSGSPFGGGSGGGKNRKDEEKGYAEKYPALR